MAKHDRCEVCDYSETFGAAHLNIAPGSNGKVRKINLANGTSVWRCEPCSDSISDCLWGLYNQEEEDGQVGED